MTASRERRTTIARVALALVAVGAAGGATACASDDAGPAYPRDAELRLSHVQALASHNSYHVEKPGNPLAEWRYTHAPLADQATGGVRAFELDVFQAAARDDFDVLHIQTLDPETRCPQGLRACLAELRAWSDAHPDHHALFVQFEAKDLASEVDVAAWGDALDRALLSAFPRERIVTPDDVRGTASTLAEALTTTGWPTLGATRGKVLCGLDEEGPFRAAYTHGGADLAGRLCFVDSTPGQPFAAFDVLNDPASQAAAIAASLAAGMLVRTRADADTAEPRAGDTTRLQAALASGAHFVSTDFPLPVEGVSYRGEIPGGSPSRCNPVTAPVDCTSADVEHGGGAR